jgi:hypothetical protein
MWRKEMNDWFNSFDQEIARVKEDAFVKFSIAARWFTGASIVLYIAGCIVAGTLIGPIRYIEFLYHCTHWQRPQVEQPRPETVAPPPPHAKAGVPKSNPESSF